MFVISKYACYIKVYKFLILYAYLSQMPEKLCIFCGIQRVVFHMAFPPLLASDNGNGANTVCVRFRNGAKVVGQHRESFLHKVKFRSLKIKAHILAKVRRQQ